MERRQKRTVIALDEYQPGLNFEEADHCPPFSFPEYQRQLLWPRLAAGLTDLLIVALVYSFFVLATFTQMPEGTGFDRRIAGIYCAGLLLLTVTYFFLFMLGASQTPGMKMKGLEVVTREGTALDARSACFRGFGYLISFLPVTLGLLWAAIDPEHLTWADKVSGTYIKKTS
jgi:uncharacterized RDD family membrane protein YckC